MLWNICMLFGLGDGESSRLPVDIPSHTRPAIPGGLRSRIAPFRFTGWGKESCETVRESMFNVKYFFPSRQLFLPYGEKRVGGMEGGRSPTGIPPTRTLFLLNPLAEPVPAFSLLARWIT